MGITIQITGKEEEINLTDFTVVKYNERLDSADGRNEYMSADIWGFEIFGEINPYDKSKELEEVNKLSLWAKKTAHEDDAYRKMTVTLFDTNKEEYDTIEFKNAFFMKYEESFEAEKGSIMFYAFLREFRQEEMVVKPIQKAAYGNNVAMPFSDNEISENENLEFVGAAAIGAGISNRPADAKKVILYRDNALAFENDAYISESKRMLYSSKIVGGSWTFKRMYEEGFRKKGNDYHTYTAIFDVYIDDKRIGDTYLLGYTEGTVNFKEPYENIYITDCKEFMTRFGFKYTTNSPAKMDPDLADSIYAFYHPDNPKNFIYFNKASYDGIILDAVKFSEVYTAISKRFTITISYDNNLILTVKKDTAGSGEAAITTDWLRLYDKPTVSISGIPVSRDPKAPKYDWGMPEDLTTNPIYKKGELPYNASDAIEAAGGTWVVKYESNNLYSDQENRYWIAVGPNVMNPTRRATARPDSAEMNFGTKVDIHVKGKDGKSYYIPAVVGDCKGHSYPGGLYTTGDPFPEDKGRPKVSYDGSTVEFIGFGISEITVKGKKKSSVNITNDYELIEIIVYNAVFNY